MDKLKSVLSRNKDEEPESAGGTTGKRSGAGSHFPAEDSTTAGSGMSEQSDYSKVSSYAPGTETRGPTAPGATSSAAGVDPIAAQGTSSSETTAGRNVGSVDPSDIGGARSASATGGMTSSFAGESGSSAVVGETSTYSSHHLAKGDPTSSVADPQSSDPTTYKKPESGSYGNAGVPPGSATAAAQAALNGKEGIPGGYPKEDYVNPYKASNLDPRVDGLPARSKEPVTSTASQSTSGGAGLGTAAGVGTGAAAVAASQATRSHETSEPAQSTLTSPTQTENTLNPDSSVPAQEASSTTAPAESSQQSMFGKVLGAVGLGGVAGAVAGKMGSSDESAVVDTTDQPSAMTGATARKPSGPPPSHHRKESIPTTAYPAGPQSPSPIAPPVGGSVGATPEQHQTSQQSRDLPSTSELPVSESHTGRNTALGAAGVGAVGAAAVGAHEYEKNKDATTGSDSATKLDPKEFFQNKEQSEVGTGQNSGNTTSVTAGGSVGHSTRETTTGAINTDTGPTVGETSAPTTSEISGPTSGTTAGAPFHDATTNPTHPERESGGLAGTAAAAGGVGAGEGTAGLLDSRSKDATPVDKPYSGQTTSTAVPETSATTGPHDDSHVGRDAGLAAAGVGAGAYGAHEYDRHQAGQAPQGVAQQHLADRDGKQGLGDSTTRDHHKHQAGAAEAKEKEKKPNILKRIFKRRKNKDTGADEEYSTDEEDAAHVHDSHHAGAATGAAAGAGAAGVAATGSQDGHFGRTDEPTTKYEEASGGFQKPSYNPFKKQPAESEGDNRPRESITGMPYDPAKDPEAAARLQNTSAEQRAADYVGNPAGYTETMENPPAEQEANKAGLGENVKNVVGLGSSEADHSHSTTHQEL